MCSSQIHYSPKAKGNQDTGRSHNKDERGEKVTVYDTVKRKADDAGISISALEVKAGMANGTIAGWRTGRPYAETLKKVAEALKVTIDELME